MWFVPLKFLLVLAVFANQLRFIFLKFIYDVLEFLNLTLDFSHFFFGLLGLGLEIHSEFFIFLLVLMERFLAFIQLFFLHNDVFFE